MTPREIVTRAIEFRRPARLPINGFGPVSDVTWVGYEQVKPAQAQADPALDQWMCRWQKTETPNMGQVKGHPLEDLSGMRDFPGPTAATRGATSTCPGSSTGSRPTPPGEASTPSPASS